ncbi:hypothetical protein ACOMHN_040863 [Nucella lapillus]
MMASKPDSDADEELISTAEQIEVRTSLIEEAGLSSNMQSSATHREHMDHFMVTSLMKYKKHHLMTGEKYNTLMQILKDPKGTKCCPKFRHWATKRHDFALQEEILDGIPVEKIVVSVTFTDKFSKSSKRGLVTVIPTPALYDVTEDIHVNKMNHGGYKRVKLYSEDHYYGITRAYVQEFCRTCPVCLIEAPKVKNKNKTSPRGPAQSAVKRSITCTTPTVAGSSPAKYARRRVVGQFVQPIDIPSEDCYPGFFGGTSDNVNGVDTTGRAGSSQFMASLQVDMIDKSARPDGEFNHICHVLDFFSKYHVLFPLRENSPTEIATGLIERVFSYFGPPKKIYLGGGKRFTRNALPVLTELWPGITIIQGKACDTFPSQKIAKAVEAELVAVKRELELEDDTPFPWSSHLAKIMFSLNSRKPDPKLDTPYGVVFSQPPQSAPFLPGLGGRIIDEEQLDTLIGELLG